MPRKLGVLLAAALLVPPAAAQSAVVADQPLIDAALTLELHHGKRRTKGSRIEKRLGPAVRAALNEWAPLATALELDVAVPESAPALVLGTVDEDELEAAARVLDETFELLDALRPAGEHAPASEPAVIALIFDEDGLRGAPLAGVVDALVERRALTVNVAEQFKAAPGGLSMRHASVFIQPGFDMAGDAAAGDDEFRLGNAVAHKAVQCALTERFGQLPRAVLWGLGFVVEQRLFESVYHFDARGFVHSVDHFDWPDKARDVVEDGALAGSDTWLDDEQAGRLTEPQLLTWAQLDRLLHDDAETLSTLLTAFGEQHRVNDRFGNRIDWAGDADEARALLVEHVDSLSAKALRKHLKRMR